MNTFTFSALVTFSLDKGFTMDFDRDVLTYMKEKGFLSEGKTRGILETYYKHFEAQHKPFTPRNIIYRWAPPNENDSEAYLRRVCQLTNLAGNEALVRPSLLRVQSTTAWRGGGGEVKVLELLKVLKGFAALSPCL